MTESLVRPESWISEVLRINSHFGGINELEFGYSQLYAIVSKRLKMKGDIIVSKNKMEVSSW